MSTARTLKHVSLLLFILSALCATTLARAAAPSLTGASPASGQANAVISLTLSGTGFDTATLTNNVVSFGTLTPAQSVASADASSLVATVTLPSGPGVYNVTVTTPGGQSNPVTFTVNPLPSTVPTLTSVSNIPSSAITGNVVTLNLSGTNFTPTGNTLAFTPTGGGAPTTFGPVNDVSASVITASVTLPAAGTYDVTVTNGGGGPSNPISFTVNVPPPPALTGLSPSSGQVGAVVTLSFTGSGFDAATPANNVVRFGALTPTQSVNSGTTAAALSVSVTLPSSAGAYSVSVSTGSGTSNPVTFTVNPPPPSVLGVASSPATAFANNLVTLTVGGTGFTTASPNTVTLTGVISGNIFTFGTGPAGSGTSLALSGTLPAADTYAVQVSNANGVSGSAVTLVVNLGPAPTLVTVFSAPSPAIVGASTTLSLSGTGFLAGANTVTLTGTTGANTNVATTFGAAGSSDGTDLTLVGALPSPADTYKVTVVNANGTTGTASLVVNNPAPTITGLSPSAGVAQTTLASLTVTGTGFVAGSAPKFVSTDGTTILTPTGFTVNSATQITVSGLLLPNSPGTVTITVTNPGPGGGTSNMAPFTVNPTPPALTGVASSPAAAITGLGATLTLTGSGFTTASPNTVTLTATTGGSALVFGSAPAGSSGSLALSGTLPAAGDYNVQVSNVNGASGTYPFTVNNPVPAITGLSPGAGVAQTTIGKLIITGTGFVTGTGGSTPNFTFTPSGSSTSSALTPTGFTRDSATQITVSGLPLPAVPGTVFVTVANPDPGASTSNAAPFTVSPPPPTLSNVVSSPPEAITGTGATLTLSGAGFTTTTPNSVTLTGTTGANFGKVFTFGSAPAASGTGLALSGTLPAPDTYNVQVSNANGTSGTFPFTVNPSLPPTLVTVASAPSSAITGTLVTLSLSGTGFLASTNAVTLTGTTGTNANVATTFGAAGSSDGTDLTLTGTLPLPADTYAVTVSNGNGTSAAQSLIVTPVPVPTLAGVAANPTTAITGTPTTLTLTGTNFTTASPNTVTLTPVPASAGTAVSFGSAASTNGTSLAFSGTLPASGTYAVTVNNQYGTSGTSSFIVNNPAPLIFGLTPTSGSPTLNSSTPSIINPLTITGTGFVIGANGSVPNFSFTPAGSSTSLVLTPASFTVDSTTQITVHQLTLPTASGLIAVSVTNPDPGGSTSTAVPFTVNAPPSLATVTLATGTGQAGSSATLTLTGTGFTTLTTNTVFFNGLPFGSATSPDGVTLLVSGALPALANVYSVTVKNVNGTTNPGSGFTVTNPTPIIINIDPKSGPAGNTVTTLTITGSGFVTGVNGSVPNFSFTPAGSSTSLVLTPTGFTVNSAGTQITVSGLLLPTSPGTITITVSNPNSDPAKSVSNAVLFQVSTIAPTLSSVSSSQAPTPGLVVTLTLIGTNYLSSKTGPLNTITLNGGPGNVSVFGTALATDRSGTAITVVGTLPSIPGIYTVTVSNINGISSALTFTINNPVPTISAPGLFHSDGTTAYTSDTINTKITLVIQGTGFLPTATAGTNASVPVITFNGTTLSASAVVVGSTTQMTLTNLTLPATAGAITIKVRNPDSSGGSGGLDSNPAQFNAINTSPAISGVARADGKDIGLSIVNEAIDLTITGTGFVAGAGGSSPNFSFTPAGTQPSSTITPSSYTVNSATQITVKSLQLPPAPGTVSVTVTNPGIAASSPFTFQVGAQKPALGALNPASILVGDPAFTTLTVNSLPLGTFVSASTVSFGGTDTDAGTPLTTTFNSTSILTAATQTVQEIGQYDVRVHTPNGSKDTVSPPALFSVLPLGPTHPDSKGNPTPVGLATNYFAAKPASGHDGFLFFSVPYDYASDVIDPAVGSIVLEDVNASTLIGTANPLRLFAVWNPALGHTGYEITGSGTLANTLVLGRGYWGRFPEAAAAQTVVTGLVSRGLVATDAALKSKLDGAGRFKIALLPGWNMIGDPWESPVGVRLQNIQVATLDGDLQPFVGGLGDASAQGLTSSVFFEYDSTAGQYVVDDGTGPDARLRPYVGYWVHAYRACTLLVPQP